MKKNLAEILYNADASDLDGMFDGVAAEKTNEKNIKNKVLGNKSGKKKSVMWRLVPIAASFALVVTACALVIPRLANRTSPAKTPGSDSGQPMIKPMEEYDSSLNALLRRYNVDRIIWSDKDEPAYVPKKTEITEWNGIKLTKDLYDRLQTAADDDLFAITAKRDADIPDSFDDFVYEGKTGSYYKNKLNEASTKYGAIMEIKGCADGKEEGSAEGLAKFNKWVKDYIIEVYGEEFLSRYYHDGKFDLKNLSEDSMKAYDEVYFWERANNEAYNEYAGAAYPRLYVFREYNGIWVYTGYHEETDTHYYISVMTKAQLSTLKADYDKAEKTVGEFNFDKNYFSMVSYPEDDIANMNKPPQTSDETEDPNQIPDTMA